MVVEVFVGGFHHSTKTVDLSAAFSEYDAVDAQVKYANKNPSKLGGKRRQNFGYVSFASDEAAQKAITGMHGKEIKGKVVELSLKREAASTTPTTPSSGKKASTASNKKDAKSKQESGKKRKGSPGSAIDSKKKKPMRCIPFAKGHCKKGDACLYTHAVGNVGAGAESTGTTPKKGKGFVTVKPYEGEAPKKTGAGISTHNSKAAKKKQDSNSTPPTPTSKSSPLTTPGADSSATTTTPAVKKSRRNRSPPLCNPFMHDSCEKGGACTFTHEVALISRVGTCPAYVTEAGCGKGPRCMYRHIGGPKPENDDKLDVPPPPEGGDEEGGEAGGGGEEEEGQEGPRKKKARWTDDNGERRDRRQAKVERERRAQSEKDKAAAAAASVAGKKAAAKKLSPDPRGVDKSEMGPCRDYKKKRCARGDECPFSHAGAGACLKDPKALRGVCKTWTKTGACGRGENCTFKHPAAAAAVPAAAAAVVAEEE